mmetsp:Transcript_36754/g.98456  ORF Transcript_36754/g.98456 Transcript_36754/m.98456 type:complete len:206 (-) Transcript_36754:302-919(-)
MTLTIRPAASQGCPPSGDGDVDPGDGGLLASTRCLLAPSPLFEASCSSLTASTADIFGACLRFCPSLEGFSSDSSSPKSSATPFFLAGGALGAAAAELEEADMPKEMGASPSSRCISVNSDSRNPPSAFAFSTWSRSLLALTSSSASSALSMFFRASSRILASGVLSTYWMYQPLGVLSIVHWFVRPKYCTKLLRVTQIVEFMWV